MPINIQPSHKGLLHKALGIAPKKNIPVSVMESRKKNASPKLKKQLQFAMNARHFNHK